MGVVQNIYATATVKLLINWLCGECALFLKRFITKK